MIATRIWCISWRACLSFQYCLSNTASNMKVLRPGESPGRWKYMIIVGAAIVNFFNTGTAKSFGVLISDLAEDLDTGVSILGFGIGMCHGAAVGLTFLTRPLLKKTTCRVLTMIGGCVSGFGFCICSISGNAALFTSGIAVAGFGYSFMIISNVVIVKTYFPDSFPIAISFSLSTGAVGMMLIPVITEKLANIYGWRGSLLLIAAMNFHNVLAGALFRPLTSTRHKHSYSTKHDGTADSARERRTVENSNSFRSDEKTTCRGQYSPVNAPEQGCSENKETQSGANFGLDSKKRMTVRQNCEQSLGLSECDDEISEKNRLIPKGQSRAPGNFTSGSVEEESEATTEDSGCMRRLIELFDLRLLYDFPALNPIMIAGLLSGATTTGWVAFLLPNAQEKGYNMDKAVLLASVGGLGNFIGRFCIGYMLGKWTTARTMFIVCNLICGAAFCLDYVTTTFWGLSILSALNGSTIGAMTVLISLMIEEIVDESRFTSGVALAYFFLGLGEIVGGLFAGWLYDISHTYVIAFIALGVLNVLGALLTAIVTFLPCSLFRNRHLDDEE
ncbi:monocarboxylate transporter 9 [Strongylocentrotus purpuratus]|uniref:Major facilitator superfamily (MFS) profile domain-containing protein n=1 Tax=Strongylocentrotus purpuratus TaxID=7668 RepID=A0A7M7NEY3_STRPU|nr:monocarboxylate transporter 9 [Strongylocentrotus purpuratus]|eukprot:XP_003724771.2 PREDICTED: monocarboxylate transporter 9 [Strongylocentrotus purpuratus]